MSTKVVVSMSGSTLRKLLSAHLIAACKDWTRPCISGVALACDGGDRLTLVSTNGHRLLRSVVDAHEVMCPDEPVILPPVACKAFIAALKGCTGKLDHNASLELEGDTWTLRVAGTSYAQLAMNGGQFPQYKQSIPDYSAVEVTRKRIGIDGNYLCDVSRVMLPGKDTISLVLTMGSGDLDALRFDSAVPSLGLEQTYVVMPMRLRLAPALDA